MKTTSFKIYSDYGHGWIAVKKSVLAELDIADQISNFSYTKGQTAYLEEDCDGTLFARRFKDITGAWPDFEEVDHGERSPIRNYQQYTV